MELNSFGKVVAISQEKNTHETSTFYWYIGKKTHLFLCIIVSLHEDTGRNIVAGITSDLIRRCYSYFSCPS